MDGERAAAGGPELLRSGRGGAGPADFVALLPAEVSSRIFGDLDVESLCHASVTCKGWHRVIESNDGLWRHHCLSVRAVCQREIDCDRGNGYSWKVKVTPATSCRQRIEASGIGSKSVSRYFSRAPVSQGNGRTAVITAWLSSASQQLDGW